jgi:hypothetical protein
MIWETPERDISLGPRERAGLLPFAPTAASDRVGGEAARYADAPGAEIEQAPFTHMHILFHRPPDEVDLRYEDVGRHVPPPAGSISAIPAGKPGPLTPERAGGFAPRLPGAMPGRGVDGMTSGPGPEIIDDGELD